MNCIMHPAFWLFSPLNVNNSETDTLLEQSIPNALCMKSADTLTGFYQNLFLADLYMTFEILASDLPQLGLHGCKPSHVRDFVLPNSYFLALSVSLLTLWKPRIWEASIFWTSLSVLSQWKVRHTNQSTTHLFLLADWSQSMTSAEKTCSLKGNNELNWKMPSTRRTLALCTKRNLSQVI